MEKIFFDAASGGRPSRAAREAAEKAMELRGNPSSVHGAGLEAKKELEAARAVIAEKLRCGTDEIFFTSGGTEANNLAVFSAARAGKRRAARVISTEGEHPSVELPLRELEKEGFEVIRIAVKKGVPDYQALEEALKKPASLVSVMTAGNETGAVYDPERIAGMIKKSGCGAVFHTDAVQSFMKITDSPAKYCGIASLSAHKINGLKGCGALYVKKGLKIKPLLFGGGQENGLRSGTENITGICAFGAAVRDWAEDGGRIGYINGLKKYFIEKISGTATPHIPENALGNIILISVTGVKSEICLNYLSEKGIYVSAGSACSAKTKDNRALKAYGLDKEEADSALRISFDHTNDKKEIDIFAAEIKKCAAEFGAAGIKGK